MAVIEFEVNDGGGSGICGGRIEVRTDTTKLSNFGDGRNLVGEGKRSQGCEQSEWC